MSILTIFIVIIIFGLLLWAVNTYLPLDDKVKQILNIVAIIFLVIWILKITGIIAYLTRITV